MRKQLYLDIKNRLKEIKGSDGEQLFKHFDLWNQQVEFIQQETPFYCPAIFVEFMPMTWKTIGNKVQDTELTTRLHIVTDWNAPTADGASTEQQALEFLDIIDHVAQALQGFNATNTGRWMRTQSITNHNHEALVDNVEEYICNLRDSSAALPPGVPVMVEPVTVKNE
jgi:hypothetical protein